MSQSGLLDPARDADWDAWYADHLRVMVTVNGVDTAQRFKTATVGYPPSLAMYSFGSAQVFQDAYYQSIRGLGEFAELIDRSHYHRNLFAGLDHAPQVAPSELLLVWDSRAPQVVHGIEFTWLEAVAIDKSTPYRGIAVVDASRAGRLPPDMRYARYRPATSVFHKPSLRGS